MARAPGRDAIYEVVELFKQRCLVESKSLLWPDRSAWTSANTTALWTAFIERPDTSKRSFREKWRDQLQHQSEDVHRLVLVQPEMEKRRSPLVSIPPFGRGFSRHGVFRSDGGWAAQERALTPPFIVSMSPPGYPSAWLRPRAVPASVSPGKIIVTPQRAAVSQHPVCP